MPHNRINRVKNLMQVAIHAAELFEEGNFTESYHVLLELQKPQVAMVAALIVTTYLSEGRIEPFIKGLEVLV